MLPTSLHYPRSVTSRRRHSRPASLPVENAPTAADIVATAGARARRRRLALDADLATRLELLRPSTGGRSGLVARQTS